MYKIKYGSDGISSYLTVYKKYWLGSFPYISKSANARNHYWQDDIRYFKGIYGIPDERIILKNDY